MSPSRDLAPDLVVVDARLLPPPGSRRRARHTAVSVRDGRIHAVGDDAEVLASARPGTEVATGGGGLLVPGLDDAHCHVLAGGAAEQRLALHGAASLDDLQRLVADAVAREERGEGGGADDGWVVGHGWTYLMLPTPLPRREWLDAVAPSRPVVLVAFDGHTAWANSEALARAGIDRRTVDPPLGSVVRDADGEPTGALLDAAIDLVADLLPARGTDDLVEDLRTAQARLHRWGVTAVQDAGTVPTEMAAWARLRDEDGLRLRARLALPCEPGQDQTTWGRTLDAHEDAVRALRDPAWLDGGILKCFVDGVVETGTAAMLAPYGPDGGSGEPRFEAGELAWMVTEADRRGWQVEAHAIGDRAVRMTLDAFEAAARANGPWSAQLLQPGRAPQRRHRIEHVEVVTEDDVARFARLGTVASMQPLHAAGGHLEQWLDLLGAERVRWTWPMRQLVAAGAHLAIGTDWPVVGADPLPTLAAACQASNLPSGATHEGNDLTLLQALHAYTHGSAVAAHAEHRRGTLTPGHDADLTLFDRDLLAVPPHEVSEAAVRLTVVDGHVVHRAP